MGTYKLSYTGQEVNNILGTAKTLSAKVADLEGALDSLPSTSEGSPIAGIVYPFAGETIPEGFLICDGEAYSRDEYAELFEAIGTTYGEGDGTTTFNVPDLQTRVPVGAGVDYELGEIGGEEEHTLTIDEMPSHNHSLKQNNNEGSNTAWISSVTNVKYTLSTENINSTGGDQPHNNMQPYTVVNYIISTGKSADARPMTISETTAQSSAVAGMVYPFAGEGDPEGFLLCDGSEYSRTDYAKLFDAIGTTYGSGDGSTTFNVPNLESRVIIGESDDYALGETGGEAEHILTEEEMPSHSHSFKGSNAFDGYDSINLLAPGNAYPNNPALTTGSGYTSTGTLVMQDTGSDQPHNNMQPYVVMRYFISTGEGGVVSGGSGNVVDGTLIADTIDSNGKCFEILNSDGFKVLGQDGNAYLEAPFGIGEYSSIGYGNYQNGTDLKLFGNQVTITSTAAGMTNRAYGVNKVLWSGSSYMNASQTATLSEAISAQPNGVILVFSGYDPSTSAVNNYGWNFHFVPKYHSLNHSGQGCVFNNWNSTGNWLCLKYLYIYDTKITGHDQNDDGETTLNGSGTSRDNTGHVLRYVIGV